MIHDITYQELVSTGLFHLIQIATSRNEIARYFRTAEGTIATRRNLTRDVWRTFRELAGSSPLFFIDLGGTISEEQKDRLIGEIEDSCSFERDLRFLVSRLEFLDRSYGILIERNKELSDKLRANI